MRPLPNTAKQPDQDSRIDKNVVRSRCRCAERYEISSSRCNERSRSNGRSRSRRNILKAYVYIKALERPARVPPMRIDPSTPNVMDTNQGGTEVMLQRAEARVPDEAKR